MKAPVVQKSLADRIRIQVNDQAKVAWNKHLKKYLKSSYADYSISQLLYAGYLWRLEYINNILIRRVARLGIQ